MAATAGSKALTVLIAVLVVALASAAAMDMEAPAPAPSPVSAARRRDPRRLPRRLPTPLIDGVPHASHRRFGCRYIASFLVVP
uniref:Uncharacterized protein n=1 Tax=Arundo donax TaxID=35708 RepID=A0A0A9BTU8_ARUDO